MRCFLVEKDNEEKTSASVTDLTDDQMPDGQVTVRIEYSSLNYKDALAAEGQPGVALTLPLVPGIDAAGTVVQSTSPQFSSGQQVIIAHENFGTRSHGGWRELASVPADWCVELPPDMTTLDAMTLGTAGFTAAQSVEKILEHQVGTGDGPVIVSGATGGVGIIAVRLLSQLGFDVVAATGKMTRRDWLLEHGASEVVDRSELQDSSGRPLLKSKWSAAVDTVGGEPLATIIRGMKRGGVVTACGLVAGHDLNLTVFPFILRGVVLQGIDSAGATQEFRQHLWNRLAGDWAVQGLEAMRQVVPLSEITEPIAAILQGGVAGRTVVDVKK